MKLGILTSVDTRHRYFAKRLCDAFTVSAVVYEQTGYAHAQIVDDLTPEEHRIVEDHFAQRRYQEQQFFGHHSDWVESATSCQVLKLEPGTLNSPETLQFLLDAGVDALAVFGTNLIRDPLLTHFSGRLINLHLGLSPYYRGTATNFYPLINEEPQYVGATIHLIDAGIDSGPILRHARPTIEANDQPHTIGCKAIEAGIEAIIAVLRKYQTGDLVTVPQWDEPNAKLYLRKDYHPRQVVELYRKINAGLIPAYVSARQKSGEHDLRLVF